MAGEASTPLGVGMMIVSSKFTVGPSGDVWALWCPLDSAGAAIGGESANEKLSDMSIVDLLRLITYI